MNVLKKLKDIPKHLAKLKDIPKHLKKLEEIPKQIVCAIKFGTNTVAGICVVPYLLNMIWYVLCYIPKIIIKIIKLEKEAAALNAIIANSHISALIYGAISPYFNFFLNSCYRCKNKKITQVVEKTAKSEAGALYNFFLVLLIIFSCFVAAIFLFSLANPPNL